VQKSIKTELINIGEVFGTVYRYDRIGHQHASPMPQAGRKNLRWEAAAAS
jgi:hypothetical protein